MAGDTPGLGEILRHFSLDVPWIAIFVASAAWYAIAFRRSRAQVRISRHPLWKLWAFEGGVLLFAIAVLSPLEYYGNRVLWVNFTGFLLLTMIAPPLVLLGSPLTLAFRVSGPTGRRRLRGFYRSLPVKLITFPVASALLYAAVTYLCQFSDITDAAATNSLVRDAQLFALLVISLVFWYPALAIDPLRWRMPHPLRALYVVEEMAHKGLFGAFLLSLSTPFHAGFAENLPAWAPSPMTDQRLAILILWVGGNLIFIGVIFAIIARWMEYEVRNNHRVDRRLRLEREAQARRDAAIEQVFTKSV